ncbi:hypothetical protein [Streptomyces sp. NPDC093223]|uniref:hypothetical protein n=1 Tax=Streptomyces sp. NPDC093223 TaxID=3366033 RepID=UPI0038081B37
MSRATRRNVVMHLMRCRMSVPQIASELGVSADTVRRDAAAAEQDAHQDAQDAHQVMRPDAVPVAPQVERYEVLTADLRAQLAEPLTVAQLDALEAVDEDGPARAVAARLATFADWHEALTQLGEDAPDTAYLEEQRAAYDRAHAAVNEVFVRWHFGGWARLPQADEDDLARPRPDAPLVLSWTAEMRRDIAVLCAAYKDRPQNVTRFAVHQAARGVSALQARRNAGRRTA